MSNAPTNQGSSAEPGGSAPRERWVFVSPEQGFGGTANDEISLRDLWEILWRGKWIIVAVTAVFVVASVA